MDEDFKDLEEELRRLRPQSPSQRLVRRLESVGLQRHGRGRGWMRWMAFPAMAAAVVLGFLFLRLSPPRPTAHPLATAAFKPVAAENLLLDASDEGYTTLEDGTPARRVRRSYIDTITWKDPRTNASLTWSLPREEIRVIPVAFQ
ncbi:MAG: hypothetical protein ABIZ81_17915 [Opitutaceae bacterium]